MEKPPQLKKTSPEAKKLHQSLYNHLRPDGKLIAHTIVPLRIRLKTGEIVECELQRPESAVPSPEQAPESAGFRVSLLPPLDVEHLSQDELDAEIERRNTLTVDQKFAFMRYEVIDTIDFI